MLKTVVLACRRFSQTFEHFKMFFVFVLLLELAYQLFIKRIMMMMMMAVVIFFGYSTCSLYPRR